MYWPLIPMAMIYVVVITWIMVDLIKETIQEWSESRLRKAIRAGVKEGFSVLTGEKDE